MIKNLSCPKGFYIIIFLSIILFSSCESAKFIAEIEEYRQEYKANFDTDSHAPLKGTQLDSMRFFPPRSKYQVVAKAKMILNGKTLQIPTSSGKQKVFKEYALAEFTVDGVRTQLTIYQNQRVIAIPKYKDYLFLPFNDLTNGEESYGGGRYIDITIQDIKNDKVLIDFNKAYNPYCHYSAGYNCPIPPVNNQLNIAIKAGERSWIGTYIGDKH